jgi:hypothetical protein
MRQQMAKAALANVQRFQIERVAEQWLNEIFKKITE